MEYKFLEFLLEPEIPTTAQLFGYCKTMISHSRLISRFCDLHIFAAA